MKVLNIGIYHGGVLSLLLGGIIGCTPLTYLGLAQTPVTPINELKQHQQPAAEADSQEMIYLQGTVVDQAPFMDNGSYQLQDATGKVWVLTNGNLPKPGDEITIKGQIKYQPISVGGKDLGELYVVEIEQLNNQPHTPSQPAQPVSSPQPEPELKPEPKPEPKPKPKPELDINDLLLPHKSNPK